MKHKISIIIPVYGVELYIEDCLKSVAAQDYRGQIECIIVDDCSPDKSMDLVKQYVDNYTGPISFILVFREKNGGLSAARNSGIEVATGDYIYFLDSDDEITSDCIRLLQKPLEKKDFDYVIGSYKRAESTWCTVAKLQYKDDCEVCGDQVLFDYCSNKLHTYAWNKLCKTKLLKSGISFKEGILYEDAVWSFNLALVAKSIYVVTDVTYIYKIREGSIMTSKVNYDKKYTSNKIIINEMCKLAVQYGRQKDFIVCRRILWRFYYSLITHHKSTEISLFETYKDLRLCTSIEDIPRLSCITISPIYFFRDFHFYLPKTLGYLLFRCFAYPLIKSRY